METESFKIIKKQEEATLTPASFEVNPSSNISFVPPDLFPKKEERGPLGAPEWCAIAGLTLGAIALISWVVILLGTAFAILGIIFSVKGLRSSRSKIARIGLMLSILGLIFSLLYAFSAYNGMINYNYFTSEFLGL